MQMLDEYTDPKALQCGTRDYLEVKPGISVELLSIGIGAIIGAGVVGLIVLFASHVLKGIGEKLEHLII